MKYIDMKINYKKNGNHSVEFNEYFKTVDDLKLFIKNNNKFINVGVLTNDITNIYYELVKLEESIKSSVLDRFLVSKFNFKFKRPNNINFWLERGFGIYEFNEYVGVKINKLGNNTENIFKFNNFKFKILGIPKCNLCDSDLIIEPTIGRYEIKGCLNINCETHKNETVSTIKQLAFLPINLYENKNNRIKVNSKLYKEYWLLKGLSYDIANEKINEIKELLVNITVNSFDYYKITTDLNDFEINKIINKQSSWCIEHWLSKGLDINESKSKVSEVQGKNADKLVKLRKKYPERYGATTETQLQYWINKGYNLKDAEIKLSERQTTFSKEICVQKYGEEKGLERFINRQEKWLNNYKRVNFSKISQELFWDVLNNNPNILNENIYFATLLDGNRDDSGKNNEYRLKLGESYILPDFFDKTNGKIIEFDGTYYHRKTPENSKREDKRDKMILDGGYKVLHVTEKDYREDKGKVINKCIEYLKE